MAFAFDKWKFCLENLIDSPLTLFAIGFKKFEELIFHFTKTWKMFSLSVKPNNFIHFPLDIKFNLKNEIVFVVYIFETKKIRFSCVHDRFRSLSLHIYLWRLSSKNYHSIARNMEYTGPLSYLLVVKIGCFACISVHCLTLIWKKSDGKRHAL